MNRFVLALLVLCAPLYAQRSERDVADDLSFARELALRYQYVDLAEAVLGQLAQERLSEGQKERLALVQCQVYAEAARREGNPKERLDLFARAAGSYQRFLDEHTGSELRAEAGRSYLWLLSHYGRALEIALAETVGEEALELRKSIRKVLDAGLERTKDLKNAYARAGLSPAEKFEKWRLMLDRAQLLISSGNVADDPRAQFSLFSLAEKELEGVASEAGETSGPGMNACLALAKLNRARGMFGTATDFAQFVVTNAVPEDTGLADWRELRPDSRAERFRLVELAIPDLVECQAASGNPAAACKWALYFYNTWKREHFQLTPFGYLALLSVARTLLDAGGHVGGSVSQGTLVWFESEEEMTEQGFTGGEARSALDLALLCAQLVNAENKGNTLQVRAQKLISDVISRPGLADSLLPDILFEAAQGEYNTKNFEQGIESFKKLMGALDGRDEALRRAYMPRVLYFLGQSYTQLARPLEAAMAFREAATTWAGDPEYQEKVAEGFYARVNEVRRTSAGDPLIERLYLQAEQVLQQSGKNDDVVWRQAERRYDAKEYDLARQGYQSVGEAANEYEKAMVKAALCLYRKNDKEGARRELEDYLEKFVPDPNHATTGAKKRAAREEARAQATFYLGRIAYDAQAHEKVLAVLEGYESAFAAQVEYAANALYMVVNSELALKNLAGARAALATMQARFPTSPNTGKAALNLYQALKAEPGAADRAADETRAPHLEQDLKEEMAQCMRVSNRVAPEPAFGNLRVESSLWIELQDWVAAEETLRATLKAFQGKAERAADIEKFVLPDLGAALLGQKRVPEAFAVLDPLVPKEAGDPRRPSAGVVRAWCRSVTGWLEGDATESVEIPGVGGDVNFPRVSELLGKLIEAEKASDEAGHGAWTCPWYQLKFEQLYALLQWSNVDSSQKAVARRLLEDIAGQLGDGDLGAVATNCGDDVLRKRYLWLRNRIR